MVCEKLPLFETSAQVPLHARSTGWLWGQLVDAVIRSGRAGSETAAAFTASWWMVQTALNEACVLALPDADGHPTHSLKQLQWGVR